MRRRNAISVRVRNPSRGLVTRLPSEEADLMRPGDKDRVYTDAKNVRFEDGVVCAAPGYSEVRRETDLNEKLVSYWKFDELQPIAPDVWITAKDSVGSNDFVNNTGVLAAHTAGYVAGKLGRAAVCEDDTHSHFHTPGSPVGLNFSAGFTVSGWFKRIAASDAQYLWRSNALQIAFSGSVLRTRVFSDAGLTINTVDSTVTLALNTWYFFVVTYDGATLKIRINNGTADTSAFAVTPDDNSVTPLEIGSLTLSSKVFYIDSVAAWTRALTSNEAAHVYTLSNGGTDYIFGGLISMIQQGNLINPDSAKQKPVTMASGGRLFSAARSYDSGAEQFVATLTDITGPGAGTEPADSGLGWSAVDYFNVEVYAQHDNPVQYWEPGTTTTQDVPGLPTGDEKWDGVESFFGHLMLWKDDRIKWCAQNDRTLWIPVAQTAASWVMTIDGAQVDAQPAPGGSISIKTTEDPASLGIVDGQYLRFDDVQGGVTYTNYYLVTAHTTGATPGTITATLLDLTGVSPAASVFTAGTKLFSVDANDAGETQNVGSHVNGPIFQILSQGDYAYIFKERSIQSIQFVGLSSGVFFIHPEIANEGLLSRSALLGLGDGRMVFVGHREIYQYVGGPTLTPILQNLSRQMYAELDRNRLDRILLFHKEFKNEVWIQYPVTGGMKTLIWNYREDTASFDIDTAERDGVTAVAEVEWTVDPTWASLAPSVTWDNFDENIAWNEVTAQGQDRFTLVATGDNRLFIHGTGYNRAGEAYTALAETQDYDFDEPDIFKYVDVVILGLQVKLPDSVTRRVYVQVGYRDWIDQDIKWTTPIPIQVQGNYRPPPVKLNPGGAGRFMRLRFYSEDIDVPWRITSYEIHCRPGSFY